MSVLTLDSRFAISTRKEWLDVSLIHRFLSAESYWAKGISRERVERSIENSFCVGAYETHVDAASTSAQFAQLQVGYARVVTDFATFAYLCDVFVIDGRRGLGLGQRLVDAAISHESLTGIRRWMLATRDAHDLYRAHGFGAVDAERIMEKFDVDAYRHG